MGALPLRFLETGKVVDRGLLRGVGWGRGGRTGGLGKGLDWLGCGGCGTAPEGLLILGAGGWDGGLDGRGA